MAVKCCASLHNKQHTSDGLRLEGTLLLQAGFKEMQPLIEKCIMAGRTMKAQIIHGRSTAIVLSRSHYEPKLQKIISCNRIGQILANCLHFQSNTRYPTQARKPCNYNMLTIHHTFIIAKIPMVSKK